MVSCVEKKAKYSEWTAQPGSLKKQSVYPQPPEELARVKREKVAQGGTRTGSHKTPKRAKQPLTPSKPQFLGTVSSQSELLLELEDARQSVQRGGTALSLARKKSVPQRHG